ncbi:hypothetical protein N2152v2_008257 [Parachlorella kessleri]
MIRQRLCVVLALLAGLRASSADSEQQAALEYLESHRQRFDQDLIELTAIPSVSALPSHAQDVLRAAEWLKARLQLAGLENIQVLPTEGPRPVVYADYLHAPGAPTALIYAHYDVQPADPYELWESPPFEPVVRDGAFWGRGVDDDKGGLLPTLQALEAILKSGGRLGINVKLMYEGEEEVGSPFLEPFLEKHKGLLGCDYVLSADGGQVAEGQPGLTLGLRGAVALEVEVKALASDVHSGMVGGAVQNPARALAQLLATLHAPNGSVAVQGFYDKVQPITDADRDDMLAYNYDEQAALVNGLGAVEPWGEEGYSTLERIWLRPTLEVVGMAGGFAGDGIKTIIPASARSKLAARLVPAQQPQDILELVEAHIRQHHPPACNVTITELGFKGGPFVASRSSPPMTAAAKVLQEEMGAAPLFVRGGATIPALALFRKALGVDTTVFGFGLPDQNVHAPNERHRLSMYHLSQRAYVKLLLELGKGGQPAGSTGSDQGREEL